VRGLSPRNPSFGTDFVRNGRALAASHDVMVVELDRGTRLVGAALVMPKFDEAFPAGSSIRGAALHKLIGAIWFSGERRSHHGLDLGALRSGADKSNAEGT
jgi:hypothetical protein